MENYRLAWNLFTSFTVETFKASLEDNKFTDVSLLCDDGKQIEAHKIILANASSFFEKILIENPHQNPLLILSGISHQSLMTIIKFIYLGDAQIPQADLDHFLTTAKYLKIKGLNDILPVEQDKEEMGELQLDFDEIKTEIPEEHEHQPFILKEEGQNKENLEYIQATAEHEQIDYQENEYEQQNFSIVGAESFNTFETNEINHKEKTKTWYFCPFCDYKASSSVSIKYHKQTVHEGVRFNCDLCDAFFTRKESLKTHIRSKHEGIKYPCDLCEYKATEKGALKKHKLSQHSLLNLQFPCQFCDFGAKTQKQHKLHMTIKHGISYKKD